MKKFFFTFLFLSLTVLSVAHTASAQATPQATQYQLLAPVPLSGAASAQTTAVDPTTIAATYLPGIIKLVIGIAGALAVIMIMIGGIQYITSATGMGKSDGKEKLYDAVIGLLLVIGAYTILYTVNPNLVQLNFASLVPDTSGTALITSGGFSYNSDGSVTPCANCNPYQQTDFPQKPAGQACQGTVCSVNTQLGSELLKLAKNFGSTNWWVTEMYPPLDPTHVSSCHNDGTCVDAALKVSNPSPALVGAFLQNIQNAGMTSFIYEACVLESDGKTCDPVQTCARINTLQTANPNFKSQITACKSTTGENVHINLSGGTSGSCGTASDGSSNTLTCS